MSDKPYRQIFTLTNKVKANKIAKAYFNRFSLLFLLNYFHLRDWNPDMYIYLI